MLNNNTENINKSNTMYVLNGEYIIMYIYYIIIYIYE